ncbi:ribonuclease H-like domain-containing protein [Tanacetum coccineum]
MFKQPSSDIHEGGDESVLSTQEYIWKVIEDVGEDEDFKGESWVRAVEFVNANGGIVNGCLGDMKDYLKNEKLKQVVAIIKSCTPNTFGDLIVTLKDLSSTIFGTIHYKVCSPKPSIYYLNITMKNLVKVFPKDIVPGNGNGVGSNGILDEEEIIKMLEEKEMAELELQKKQGKQRLNKSGRTNIGKNKSWRRNMRAGQRSISLDFT